MIQKVIWDSEKFGINVGNLLFEDTFSADWLIEQFAVAKQRDYQLLYIKDIDIPKSMLDKRFILADQKVIYKNSAIFHGALKSNNVHSLLGSPLSENLLVLAYESGKFSRFRLDKQMPSHVFPVLYRNWMKNSLNGSIATDVLGYEKDGEILGFITYKIINREVQIGLFAVLPNYVRQGVGTALMNHIYSMFGDDISFKVSTQYANIPACHFYEKMGFSVSEIIKIYHVWL